MDNKTEVNVINTNARSLRPKLASFVQCFACLSLTFAIVTETWLCQGSRLELDVENLLYGHGLIVKYLNRPPSVNGVSHGGVALIGRESSTKFKDFSFPNPGGFEVMACTVSVASIKRKFYVVGAYIPPNYTVARGRACLDHINNLIDHIKRHSQDPYLLVAGDFNQWKIEEALQDYVELVEVPSPPTREDRKIDRIFTNWPEHITDSGCLPPLETDGPPDQKTFSDHKIQYLTSRIPAREKIQWENFTYRPYHERGANGFRQELASLSWDPVYQETTSNAMAIRYQQLVDDLMDKHFPLKTINRKDSDLPWLDSKAKKMIRKKAAIYKSEGKSERWHRQLEKTETYLEKRRQGFLQKQRDKFTGPDAVRQFFKNVKSFKNAEKPKNFDIRDLRPDNTDAETAEEAAAFFNRISSEFQPLEPNQIPATYHRDLPFLSPAQVSRMLTKAKKPSSMVRGDIFPKLINQCADHLAWPLSAIYNKILSTYIWPTDWKREFVTIIPKKTLPEGFGDLRNISCTLFISKVFEQYVQKCIAEEIEMKPNQYGGMAGCSTTHMIIDIIQEICENAEDYRSATVLCAIDYAKAFNRLSYQHCLEAFRKKGSSTPVLKLIATFLTNRTMSVRVGNTWSEPLPVNGGCPQGSILGVRLFNTTTDDLEDEFLRSERLRLGLQDADPVDNDAVQPENANAGPTSQSTPEKSEFMPRLTLSPVQPVPEGAEVRRPRVKLTEVPQPVLVDPPAETRTGTQVLTSKMVRIFKYIDDNVSVEKMNLGNVNITVSVDGKKIKRKHALPTQNAFRSVTSKAKEKGMVVNAAKTNLLCVSDALNYRPEAFIEDEEGNVINCVQSMKILGFHFSYRPTVDLHVNNVITKLRQRYWVLRHLGSVGFSKEELVRVYCSSLLPLADYCCPAYHSMLTDVQDQLLERAQVGALRAIFGYQMSAVPLRQEAGVTTLRERRIRLTDKFAEKCLTSDRFKHWFPLSEQGRNTRGGEKYKEFFAKNERLKNSPLFYMRRRLNGKPGKIYGERNRKYRENFALE